MAGGEGDGAGGEGDLEVLAILLLPAGRHDGAAADAGQRAGAGHPGYRLLSEI